MSRRIVAGALAGTIDVTVGPNVSVPAATTSEGSALSSNAAIVVGNIATSSATVDYGDDSGVQPASIIAPSLPGQYPSVALAHTYLDNRTDGYTITVTVTDLSLPLSVNTAAESARVTPTESLASIECSFLGNRVDANQQNHCAN